MSQDQTPDLNEDQRDALQEIANIGMGQAGSSIAKVWGEFVHLSIPRIVHTDRKSIPELSQPWSATTRSSPFGRRSTATCAAK